MTRAFGHIAHDKWCKTTTLDKTRQAPMPRAARFTDEKDKLMRRE